MADTVEETFKGGFLTQGQVGMPFSQNGKLSPELVKAYIAAKSQRVSGIAKHFNTSETNVRAIIDNPESGLQIGERGWVRTV